MRKLIPLLALLLALSVGMAAQSSNGDVQVPAQAYQPKSADDKARSDPEYMALAYMRTVAVAQKLYFRKNNRYAGTLTDLISYGGFTRRMASPRRGDYQVTYGSRPGGYALVLLPARYDEAHRSFYIDETGGIRAEEGKRATGKSPSL